MSKKPYKCVYCGRRFKKPVPHKCKDGFRKHNLEFEIGEACLPQQFCDIMEYLWRKSEEDGQDFVSRFSAVNFSEPISTNPDVEVATNPDGEVAANPTSITPTPLDTQVGGDHYKKYKIQPIEFAMANGLNACQTNILKYIMRYKDKDGKKDLLKAHHYIDILIQTEYPNPNE